MILERETRMMATPYVEVLPCPIGNLQLRSDGEFITGVLLNENPSGEVLRDPSLFKTAIAQLRAYFAGELTEFDLAYRQAGTPFQQRVWAELVKIPYGETISYGELALRLDQPGSARAVGNANGRNQLCILVPCHRVIASGGALGGYSGGLHNKVWLLERERQ